MSKKRRDNKGRILRNGEHQRENGMYQYSYQGLDGKTKCIYSWKLEPTDTLPYGKRDCVSLRERELDIKRSIDDGVIPYGGDLTVIELVNKYIYQKRGVRPSTRAGYKTVTNILEKETFGHRKIDTIRLSDAKTWLIKLQQEDGRSYSSIHSIRGVLRPAFQMAVDDDLIKKNPFGFGLMTVIVNDSVTRDAVTHAQKRKFLEFVKNDKYFAKYYDGIYILFHTGMRISEFTGLVISDIDFDKQTLKIERQLQRTSGMEYVILPPKTKSGTRVIPISDEVCECFERIVANRKEVRDEPVVDGISGFLYLDVNDMPMVALHWEHYFKHIVEKYNRIYKEEMPKITPHVCRHTYCSHMASSGMNPKHLQYLMGHSDIGVTLNTYTHVEFGDIENEVKKLENEQKNIV